MFFSYNPDFIIGIVDTYSGLWESCLSIYEKDVNQAEVEYPVRAESGEIIFEEPLYDNTSLVIIDANLRESKEKLTKPKKPKNKLFGVEGGL